MAEQNQPQRTFLELNLPQPILSKLTELGYINPTDIQVNAIPAVLAGRDVLGQAQTGTGKTAAFSLPILANLQPSTGAPQVIILAPTRELVVQIGKSIKSYAANLDNIKIATIYGGQGYREQLRALKHGVDIVVGTPGRIKDHLTRKTLDLSQVRCTVLDEADEMLRMGFVEDVKWICQHAPQTAQMLLFSATMPPEIKKIADQHLKDPQIIKISGTTTVKAINQRYWLTSGTHKLDALSRILETETTDAVIIFVRTKLTTIDIADNLIKRGFSCQALNGDMSQDDRQHAVDRLKSGKLNILVATDVAARGLDVERISHVINYDIPFDPETYIHRIGRTGRAGRKGEALLFVSPKERRLLQIIERKTKQKVAQYKLPTAEELQKVRVNKFKQKISNTIERGDLDFYKEFIKEYSEDSEVESEVLMAALLKLAQSKTPIKLEKHLFEPVSEKPRKEFKKERKGFKVDPNTKFKVYHLGIGRKHGVRAGNILGAIANEANLDRKFIGNISIFKRYSTVELPNNLPEKMLKYLKKVQVLGKPLALDLEN